MTRILVLEDEDILMSYLRKILKRYTVLEASCAETALRRFKESDRNVGLLIADVTLPRSSGIQVALLLRAEVPDLPVILTSGYPLRTWCDRDAADFERLRSDSLIVLEKPFLAHRLLNCVRELTGDLPELARTA